MTPNEWRAVFNLPPIDGGDLPIRRLDTAAVDEDGTTISDDEPEEPAEDPDESDPEETEEDQEDDQRE